jgi:uncharacterized protein (TIGR01777 family)
MKVVVSGGTGFVGRHLTTALLHRGDRVVVLGRSARDDSDGHPGLTLLAADTTQGGDWQRQLIDADAVVNLTGVSIFKRWTKAYKRQIRDSRILTTQQLVDGLPRERPITLVSTSAIGFYGSQGEHSLDETSAPGDDFLARLSVDWEAAAEKADQKGARVVLARFGVVLGKGGGAMGQMLPAFRFFLGGPMGDGLQWFSWIHMTDLVRGLLFALDTPDLKGPVNYTAPNPVRNIDFAKALGAALHRPAGMPAPATMLRLMLGEFAGTLLASQRVLPEKLTASAFTFEYPTIESALAEIVSASDRSADHEEIF